MELEHGDLQQRALALKQAGRSVREIAKLLSIGVSKAFRLTKQGDEAETEAETVPATTEIASADADTPPDHYDLEALVARVLETTDTERMQDVLARVQYEHERLARFLADAQAREAACRQALESATLAVLNVHDPVARVQAEQVQAERQTALVEATIAPRIWEKRLAPWLPLAGQVRHRLQQIETAKKEAERQAVLAEAKSTLETAQAAFCAALADVQEHAATVGEPIVSDMPLLVLRDAVGKLRVGGLPARDLHQQTHIYFLRMADNGRIQVGEIHSMPWLRARDFIWQGVAEELRS